jgi:hypothetical protein
MEAANCSEDIAAAAVKKGKELAEDALFIAM